MFEITPQDVAQLDDKQLRTLVGLLCEAELRRLGYSAAAATWSGDQNAADGGVDVRVRLPDDKPIEGFIPRASTGFQVKKQDMPRQSIMNEMRPKGVLRPVIRELAEEAGAYVIISAEGSTADRALTSRRNAMADATKELVKRPILDFYDRGRLTSWINSHAGLIVWVRSTIGRAIPGWEPFGAWAYPAGGTKAEYLVDKGIRIRARLTKALAELPAEDGLNNIRDILRHPRSVVRLVGLSGVGKTRFAQALFDARIGSDALDPAAAVYTNMNNDPSPQPFSLASDLIANRTRAILLVDNCASDLHARLSELVRTETSLLSVLTIEYDIRDDVSEGTEVFEMRVASTDLIEKLLRSRFRALSQIDARTAAEFSGGNPRIAIVLADTVGRRGTLAALNETQLFERLFSQRQGQDRSLLEIAQTCALVYSFNGEDLDDCNGGEITRLAHLIGVKVDEVYRGVAELIRRDLAQRRGKWRAILPHALANRLATSALQNIPIPKIQECLINGAPERLTISFARRLGYLDTSPEAVKIVRDWLAPKGWIGAHIWNLNEFGKALFRNSLSAVPEAVLQSLEAGVPPHDADTPITTGDYVPAILRSLAWDAAVFDRSVRLLQKLAIHGDGDIGKQATRVHGSLFYLYLSGTHATVEQRLAVIKRTLNSANEAERALGLAALDATLESINFSSDYDFQFGARSRDYGYHPRTLGELRHWYSSAFQLAEEFALSDRTVAHGAKSVIATNFRGLWTKIGMRDELEGIAAKFAAQGFWKDGWLAVHSIRRYDEKDRTSDNFARLSRLEELLRPQDLVDITRGRVLASQHALWDIDEVDANDAQSFNLAMEQRNAEAEALGSKVAADEMALQELMPEIVGGQGNLWHLGVGLARGAESPRRLWHRLAQKLALTPPDRHDVRAFCGMIFEINKTNPELSDELLDEALETEPLARHFPSLQTYAIVNARGVARLIRSLEVGRVPIQAYGNVLLGNAVDVVPPADIANYVLQISRRPEGESVAIHLLHMQFFNDRQVKRPHSPELVEAGRKLLRQMRLDRRNRSEDFHLGGLVEVCIGGKGGCEITRAICERLKNSVANYQTYGYDHCQLLQAMLKMQPRSALNALLGGDGKSIETGKRAIDQAGHLQSNPMNAVSDTALLEWCSEAPDIRFPSAASVVSVFTVTKEGAPANWTPIAIKLVHSAPDPIPVMRALVTRVRHVVWAGSRSAILDEDANLLDQFDIQGNEALAAFVAGQKESLQREARAELERETAFDRDRDERFE